MSNIVATPPSLQVPPRPKSPALAAALAPLHRYRSTVPPLSRATLASLTPEQFAARAQTIADLEREAVQ